MAQLRRVYARYSNPSAGMEAVEKFAATFWTSFGVKLDTSCVKHSRVRNGADPESTTHSPDSWLVLPHHFAPEFSGVQKKVTEAMKPATMDFIGKVRISWRLDDKHLLYKLR